MSNTDSLMTKFKSELGKNLSDQNVIGSQAATVKREFNESNKNYKPLSFLKKDSSMGEILELVKNKRLTNNKIKSEIRKHLKDPEQLEDFLNSILDSRNKKKESKEATSAGGGVGAFEGPLFSKKETKEATSTASSGAYETPSMWAKSTSKKDWRGKAKTQIPGGKFVQVKKKCKRFPYCNQGDIKALNLSENKDMQIAIQNVSRKYGLSEEKIIEIILRETNTNKN
jgi:hypothetical protein